MVCVGGNCVGTTAIICLVVVICSVSASDLVWDGSVQTTPSTYYSVSTPNVLRCGKLCERQGKCAAVTFDVRERKCYMHDATIDATQIEEGSNGRYLIKNYGVDSKPDASENTCDKETQINIPTMRHKYGGCYNITDMCPTDKGYNRYRYPNMTLCLRYSQAGVNNHADAKAKCSADNAHLALIDSHGKRSNIIDVLKTERAPETEWMYIDGFDKDNNNVWLDWNDNSLWTSWLPDEPSETEGCIITRVSANGHMNAGSCGYQRVHFLCEIDL